MIDLCLFLGLWGVAALTKKYMLCAGLTFVFMVLDVFRNGMDNYLILFAGSLLLLWMIVKDTLKYKEDSLIIRYNPFNEKSCIAPRVRLLILILFFVAFTIRLFAYFLIDGSK